MKAAMEEHRLVVKEAGTRMAGEGVQGEEQKKAVAEEAEAPMEVAGAMEVPLQVVEVVGVLMRVVVEAEVRMKAEVAEEALTAGVVEVVLKTAARV